MRNEHAHRRARIASQQAPRPLEQANFARRTFQEKQLALNLAQFANANKDMGLGIDQVENLVGTLIVSRSHPSLCFFLCIGQPSAMTSRHIAR